MKRRPSSQDKRSPSRSSARCALLLLTLLLSCGPPPSPAVVPTATPAATPPPELPLPAILATITGTGELVTNQYELPACRKAVFVWTVDPAADGTATLSFRLHNTATDEDKVVVDEFRTDPTQTSPLRGMELYPLMGGPYYFVAASTEEAWQVRIECYDELPPVGPAPVDLAGTGNFVSGDYELPCQHALFTWEVTPTSFGSAALTAELCWKEDAYIQCTTLADVFKGEVEGTVLAGQAEEPLAGGRYFLHIYNVSGQEWSIRLECKDQP